MKFDASKGYGNLLGNLRDSPGKKAVGSLERIKRKRKASKDLKVL